MDNKKKLTEGMKSHLLLTFIFILNIVLFISCFKQSFKDELENAIFYIYLGVAALYVVFAFVDNFINKNKLFIYKIILSILNVISLISLVIIFNI